MSNRSKVSWHDYSLVLSVVQTFVCTNMQQQQHLYPFIWMKIIKTRCNSIFVGQIYFYFLFTWDISIIFIDVGSPFGNLLIYKLTFVKVYYTYNTCCYYELDIFFFLLSQFRSFFNLFSALTLTRKINITRLNFSTNLSG